MTQTAFPKLNNENNEVALVEGDKSYTYSEVTNASIVLPPDYWMAKTI